MKFYDEDDKRLWDIYGNYLYEETQHEPISDIIKSADQVGWMECPSCGKDWAVFSDGPANYFFLCDDTQAKKTTFKGLTSVWNGKLPAHPHIDYITELFTCTCGVPMRITMRQFPKAFNHVEVDCDQLIEIQGR